MSLFSGKTTGFLGIDIGTASIKIVELEAWSGKPKLVTYGYADIVTDIIRSKTPQSQQKIVNSLKKVVQGARVTTNLCLAALPTFSVFNSIISLPPMSTKDLSSAVKWEAKKYIPLPLEEMILDWKIIDKLDKGDNINSIVRPLKDKKSISKKSFFSFNKNTKTQKENKVQKEGDNLEQSKEDNFFANDKSVSSGKKEAEKDIRILVTAAPKNLVSRYLKIFNEAGLKLLSLETEAFAMARSLIGNEKETVMIVDIGSITTDICVIENGMPILNRSIDIGGLTITKAIANSLNINLERAEQFKRDFGVSINLTEKSKGINKTISTALSPIVNEIKYVFDLYQNQDVKQVKKIILSGGSAFLPNLTEYFEQLFNITTIIGNPWDKIVYPEELKPILDEVGTRLAVSIGLAMRDIR